MKCERDECNQTAMEDSDFCGECWKHGWRPFEPTADKLLEAQCHSVTEIGKTSSASSRKRSEKYVTKTGKQPNSKPRIPTPSTAKD